MSKDLDNFYLVGTVNKLDIKYQYVKKVGFMMLTNSVGEISVTTGNYLHNNLYTSLVLQPTTVFNFE